MSISDWSSDVCSSDLDRVERDQRGHILVVAPGKLVPDDDHGNAAGQPDEDQARHVFRLVAKEDDRERKHQHRPDDPVLDQRDRQHPLVFEYARRSEEHTSELQSLMRISYAVFCLKKKKKQNKKNTLTTQNTNVAKKHIPQK